MASLPVQVIVARVGPRRRGWRAELDGTLAGIEGDSLLQRDGLACSAGGLLDHTNGDAVGATGPPMPPPRSTSRALRVTRDGEVSCACAR